MVRGHLLNRGSGEGASSDADARAIARTVCGLSLVKRRGKWPRSQTGAGIVGRAGRAGVAFQAMRVASGSRAPADGRRFTAGLRTPRRRPPTLRSVPPAPYLKTPIRATANRDDPPGRGPLARARLAWGLRTSPTSTWRITTPTNTN